MINRDINELLSIACKHVSDIVWMVDMDHHLIFITPSVEKVLGYTVDEAMALTIEDVFTSQSIETINQLVSNFHNVEWDNFSKLYMDRMIELDMVHKNGYIIPIEYNGNIIFSDSGQPIGSIGVARDISSIIRLNDEIKQAYRDEKHLRESLEKEIQKRTEFSHFLVHELKTPLTAILAAIELLESVKLDPLYDRALQVIQRTSSELNNRVGELLDLTRGEIGTLKINPMHLRPTELISEILQDIEPIVTSRNIILISQIPRELPYIKADKQRLRQVLMNLVDNAIKFTPEHGEITIYTTENDDSLVFHVKDSGQGISNNNQELLFEPYYSLVNDSTRIQGFGLGLALSRQIIESHGGRIWVESELDKGSIFSFSIPIV